MSKPSASGSVIDIVYHNCSKEMREKYNSLARQNARILFTSNLGA